MISFSFSSLGFTVLAKVSYFFSLITTSSSKNMGRATGEKKLLQLIKRSIISLFSSRHTVSYLYFVTQSRICNTSHSLVFVIRHTVSYLYYVTQSRICTTSHSLNFYSIAAFIYFIITQLLFVLTSHSFF